MINHIRTIVRIAAGTALLASGLGLAAVGVAGTANADVCSEQYSDGSYFYYTASKPAMKAALIALTAPVVVLVAVGWASSATGTACPRRQRPARRLRLRLA